ETALDPLQQSQLTPSELLTLADQNEMDAAVGSLDSTLHHWRDGRAIAAREWIEELYQSVQPEAKYQGFACFLPPLLKILREGNMAQQWLSQYERGKSPQTIVQEAILQTQTEEAMLAQDLCLPLTKARDEILSLV
ncbi:putative glutamate--cysteine ligase, partial [Synechocystis sp. LEGE 06083]|nr:putative glutamate--cysteine ligase [Synechocystis sp. LEGE 06083]